MAVRKKRGAKRAAVKKSGAKKKLPRKKTPKKKPTRRVASSRAPRKRKSRRSNPDLEEIDDRPRWLGYSAPRELSQIDGMPDPLPPIAECVDEEIVIRRQDIPHEEMERRKMRFLDAMAICGNTMLSAQCAGINRRLAETWRSKDGAFSEEWDRAYADSVDRLELAARHRSVDGTDKPVTYQGEITDTYKEYSDSLLLAMLKRHDKEYSDRVRTVHSGHIVNPTTLDKETKDDVVATILGMIQPKSDPT